MYDIEGKYQQLMTIAKGKAPKLNKYDKQIKYSSICTMTWSAKRMIENCADDEKAMLKNRIIREKESAERGKRVFEFFNFAMVGIALMIDTIAFITEVAEMKLTEMAGKSFISVIMFGIVVYVLIYAFYSEHRSKIIQRATFLLSLFE